MTLRKGDVLVKKRGGKSKKVKVLGVFPLSRLVHVEDLGTAGARLYSRRLDIEPETGFPDGYVKEERHG